MQEPVLYEVDDDGVNTVDFGLLSFIVYILIRSQKSPSIGRRQASASSRHDVWDHIATELNTLTLLIGIK